LLARVMTTEASSPRAVARTTIKAAMAIVVAQGNSVPVAQILSAH
jgi:hypothetical protein